MEDVGVRPHPLTMKFGAADASCAVHARRAFVGYLTAYVDDPESLYASEVIFGELIGNVVRHAPGPLELAVHWKGDLAILSVWDGGPGYEPYVPLPDADDENHRGLFIIDTLAGGISVQREGERTRTDVILPVRLAESPGDNVSVT